VDQPGVHFSRRQSQIPDAVSVHLKRKHDLSFTDIDFVKCGSIDDSLRLALAYRSLNLVEVYNVERLVGSLHQLMAGKCVNEIAPELAVGTNEKDFQRSAPWLLR
jgi:hypothetical protein